MGDKKRGVEADKEIHRPIIPLNMNKTQYGVFETNSCMN